MLRFVDAISSCSNESAAVEMTWIIGAPTERILRNTDFRISPDGKIWVSVLIPCHPLSVNHCANSIDVPASSHKHDAML